MSDLFITARQRRLQALQTLRMRERNIFASDLTERPLPYDHAAR